MSEPVADVVGVMREAQIQLTNARQLLAAARSALIDCGYFTPDEIGPDIGPRIIEQHSAQESRIRVLHNQLDLAVEMLTAATDTAVQRGKRIDGIRGLCEMYARSGSGDVLPLDIVAEILDGGDGEL